MKHIYLAAFLAVLACSVAACGGGGGGTNAGAGSGSGSGGTLPNLPTSTPTPVASPLSISGAAADFNSGAPLVGFTVIVGQVPNVQTCNAAQTASVNACGAPVSPQPAATTSATGAFSVIVPAAGTYMLTISRGPTYATLHRTVTVGAGTSAALGTVKVAALSADEQAWLADVNAQRSTVSSPVSFANLVVDEYAEEQARGEVAAIVTGADAFGDPTETIFGSNYGASPGAMYGAAGVAALRTTAGAYLSADALWMAEQSTCPSGNWQTCTFATSTGHYINISNTQDVWVGMGESSTSYLDPDSVTAWAYAMVIPQNVSAAGPASVGRNRN